MLDSTGVGAIASLVFALAVGFVNGYLQRTRIGNWIYAVRRQRRQRAMSASRSAESRSVCS